MKLEEIIKKCTWEEVEPVFLRLFPRRGTRTEFYRKMFEDLQQTAPVDQDIFIEICYRDSGFGDSFETVGYTHPSMRDRYHRIYYIENFPWEYWLGMNVNEEPMRNFSLEEIVCICLKAMTKSGYTKEIAQEEYDVYQTQNTKDKPKVVKNKKRTKDASPPVSWLLGRFFTFTTLHSGC
jgi:hypothetical protein